MQGTALEPSRDPTTWPRRLGAFYGVLLSVSFGLMITGVSVVDDSWGDQPRLVWAILALVAAIVATDNWYNYYLAEPEISEDRQGFDVARVLLIQLVYSFYPYMFLVQVEADWISPAIVFALNLLAVSLIDVLQQAKVARGTDKGANNAAALTTSRLFAAFLLVIFVVRYWGEWDKTDSGLSDLFGSQQLGLAAILALWVPLRIVDHVVRTRFVK